MSKDKKPPDILDTLKESLKDVDDNYVFGDDIKYPITIKGLVFRDLLKHPIKPGSIVKFRFKQSDQTYLGLYLGDIPVKFLHEYNKTNQTIEILPETSPALYIFKLKKIIYGGDGVWCVIDTVKDYKDISDQDIANDWLYQAMEGILPEDNTGESKE